VTCECDNFCSWGAWRAVEVVVNVNVNVAGAHVPGPPSRFPRGHPYPTCSLQTYPLPSFPFPLPFPLTATAWASSSGHSIASARPPRSLFVLYWAPIRGSSQRAIVEMWISLAPSSSNLVSFSRIFAKWRLRFCQTELLS
jgi:hypothetical protein